MEVLFYHEQEKYERNKPLKNLCKLKIASDKDFILYTAEFYIEYTRLGRMNFLTHEHGLTIDKKTGDMTIIYRLVNKKENSHILYKNVIKAKKNNFDMLIELTQRGFYSGEKRFNFWGVKYRRACIEIYKILVKELEFDISDKDYDKDHKVNPFYDLVIDYHLDKKGIKGHDCVYWDICEAYPKKKWLKLNDNKFIPAVLDQYGIKTKYLIGALSTRTNNTHKLNLKSIRFLCTLFGDNYIDYIREFDWQTICLEHIKNNKLFTCENEAEKKVLAKALKTYLEIEMIVHDGILNTIQDLFLLKEYLKENKLDVKIKASSCHQLLTLKETWELHKKYFKIGYRSRYRLPEDMVNDLEEPIELEGKVFKPSLILTEDDFIVEGMIMKNCMAKQFPVGGLYVHASISLGKKRINIQYRKGELNQNRGKANTNPPKEFEDVVYIFSQKMLKYKDIVPVKEKYDIITDLKSNS